MGFNKYWELFQNKRIGGTIVKHENQKALQALVQQRANPSPHGLALLTLTVKLSSSHGCRQLHNSKQYSPIKATVCGMDIPFLKIWNYSKPNGIGEIIVKTLIFCIARTDELTHNQDKHLIIWSSGSELEDVNYLPNRA